MYAETIENYKAVLNGKKLMLSCIEAVVEESDQEVRRQFATIFIDAALDIETACQDRATEIETKFPEFCGRIAVSVVETEVVAQQLLDLQTWIAMQDT